MTWNCEPKRSLHFVQWGSNSHHGQKQFKEYFISKVSLSLESPMNNCSKGKHVSRGETSRERQKSASLKNQRNILLKEEYSKWFISIFGNWQTLSMCTWSTRPNFEKYSFTSSWDCFLSTATNSLNKLSICSSSLAKFAPLVPASPCDCEPPENKCIDYHERSDVVFVTVILSRDHVNSIVNSSNMLLHHRNFSIKKHKCFFNTSLPFMRPSLSFMGKTFLTLIPHGCFLLLHLFPSTLLPSNLEYFASTEILAGIS